MIAAFCWSIKRTDTRSVYKSSSRCGTTTLLSRIFFPNDEFLGEYDRSSLRGAARRSIVPRLRRSTHRPCNPIPPTTRERERERERDSADVLRPRHEVPFVIILSITPSDNRRPTGLCIRPVWSIPHRLCEYDSN